MGGLISAVSRKSRAPVCLSLIPSLEMSLPLFDQYRLRKANTEEQAEGVCICGKAVSVFPLLKACFGFQRGSTQCLRCCRELEVATFT